MSLWDRSERPNPSKEEMGVITRHGLLAHGVKPNPFVSPASYLGHSGIATEKGQKNLEHLCKKWTVNQLKLAIDEENKPQVPFGKHKARASASTTPLMALLEELEKGKIPSDVMPNACFPGTIGSTMSKNISSGEYNVQNIGSVLLRSPKGKSPGPRSPRRRRPKTPTKSRPKLLVETDQVAPPMAPSAFELENVATSPYSLVEERFLKDSWEKAKQLLRKEKQNGGKPQRIKSFVVEVQSDDDDENEEDEHKGEEEDVVQKRITEKLQEKDDKWFDARIRKALEDIIGDRAREQQQQKAITTEDESSKHHHKKRIARKKKHQELDLQTVHLMQEEQIKREIDRLDSQLSDIQSMISSSCSSSSEADDELSTSSGCASSGEEEEIDQDAYDESILDAIRELEAQLSHRLKFTKNRKAKNVPRINTKFSEQNDQQEEEEEHKTEEEASFASFGRSKKKKAFSPVVSAVKDIMSELSPRSLTGKVAKRIGSPKNLSFPFSSYQHHVDEQKHEFVL